MNDLILIISNRVQNINKLTKNFHKDKIVKKITNVEIAISYININANKIKFIFLDDSFKLSDVIIFLEFLNENYSHSLVLIGDFNKDFIDKQLHVLFNLNYELITSLDEKKSFLENDFFQVNNDLKQTNIKSQKPLVLSTLSKIEFIDTDDILYLKANGRCTDIHLKNDVKKTSSKNLGSYIDTLDSNIFFRIHKKFIINAKSVAYISKKDGLSCILVNGDNLPVSGTKKGILNEIIKRR